MKRLYTVGKSLRFPTYGNVRFIHRPFIVFHRPFIALSSPFHRLSSFKTTKGSRNGLPYNYSLLTANY